MIIRRIYLLKLFEFRQYILQAEIWAEKVSNQGQKHKTEHLPVSMAWLQL